MIELIAGKRFSCLEMKLIIGLQALLCSLPPATSEATSCLSKICSWPFSSSSLRLALSNAAQWRQLGTSPTVCSPNPFMGSFPVSVLMVVSILSPTRPTRGFAFKKVKILHYFAYLLHVPFLSPSIFITKKKIITRSAAFSGEIQLWSYY